MKNGQLGTSGGGSYNILDFKPEHVNTDDIFLTLGNICRYGGRCNRFYSVAQHSLVVAEILRSEMGNPFIDEQGALFMVLGGLCHDFAEAYIGDIPTPIKRLIPGIKRIEDNILEVMNDIMPIGRYYHPSVKNADEIALYNEAINLGFNVDDWGFSDNIKDYKLSSMTQNLIKWDLTPESSGRALKEEYRHLSKRVSDAG